MGRFGGSSGNVEVGGGEGGIVGWFGEPGRCMRWELRGGVELGMRWQGAKLAPGSCARMRKARSVLCLDCNLVFIEIFGSSRW